MKNYNEINSELKRQYLHRLQLRVDRKLKNCCKNCKRGAEQEFNLGEFGTHTRFGCKDGVDSTFPCSSFEPIYNMELIEKELLEDIKDPAVCGAKEPKIAALLWVLHDENQKEDVKKSLFSKIKKILGAD